ncbi:hypothetical protein BC829DRAFT_284818 [Chytridium lagenaria]|nr:hypothetical protein BC829DRAFT_284818 [Chytridium lagenaria]
MWMCSAATQRILADRAVPLLHKFCYRNRRGKRIMILPLLIQGLIPSTPPTTIFILALIPVSLPLYIPLVSLGSFGLLQDYRNNKGRQVVAPM